MEAKAQSTPPVRLDVLNKDGGVQYSAEFTKDKIVLGRVLSADLRLDDSRVSRIHALLEIRGSDLLITDLASTHGTFVNGEKIVESRLKFGDTIALGGVTLKLEKGSGQASNVGAPASATQGDRTQTSLDIGLDFDSDTVVSDRRDSPDRRKQDTFQKERRSDDRRSGDRRVEQRKGERRKKDVPINHPDRRVAGSERRKPREVERRVGDRRKNDRRVFDITSLERRIEDRRERKNDEDMLPEELEAAFVQPDHARELEVTALWGDHILDVSNYADPITLNVGEAPENQYIIPSEGIPYEFPLVTIGEDTTAHLAFTDQMTGTVRVRDSIYRLQDLPGEQFVRKSGGYYTVPLRQDDFAKVAIGNINFFILHVKPAPRVRPAPMLEKDGLLFRTMVGSALLTFLTILGLSFLPEPKPVTIEMIPERFAKIVIKKKPNIDAIIQDKMSMDGGSKMGEGAKAPKPEGAPMPAKENKEEKAAAYKQKSEQSTKTAAPKKAAPTPRKVVDAKNVQKVGLLEAFSASGLQNNVKQMLDKNVGVDAFDKGLTSSRGGRYGGSGQGMGLKGVDVGGGGNTIGIDGPSTKGMGGGMSGDGIGEGIDGPGRLGQKGEHSVSVVSENIQVLSGLPKDVINRIVQDNRGLIRRCYETARRRNPTLKGKVVISFKIDPNGHVTYADVKESTIGDSTLEQCIVARIRTLRFPKPEAPVETEVGSYPFYLNPVN